jgi:hypothetical protein
LPARPSSAQDRSRPPERGGDWRATGAHHRDAQKAGERLGGPSAASRSCFMRFWKAFRKEWPHRGGVFTGFWVRMTRFACENGGPPLEPAPGEGKEGCRRDGPPGTMLRRFEVLDQARGVEGRAGDTSTVATVSSPRLSLSEAPSRTPGIRGHAGATRPTETGRSQAAWPSSKTA